MVDRRTSFTPSVETDTSSNLGMEDKRDGVEAPGDDKLKYWRNRAMAAIKKNSELEKTITVLKEELEASSRVQKRLERRSAKFQYEMEAMTAEFQNHSMSVESEKRLHETQKRNEAMKKLLGTSIRDKWSNRDLGDKDESSRSLGNNVQPVGILKNKRVGYIEERDDRREYRRSSIPM